jgi:hypothetical protein
MSHSTSVEVFQVEPPTQAGAQNQPKLIDSFTVESNTQDSLRLAARQEVISRFGSVRSLAEGPRGIVAYVERK